ncbi:MAG: 50S ribosomal protein L19 [Methylotenera sp.]|nr:50S ribosomal protein L19 [Oligoflexia bacterium]
MAKKRIHPKTLSRGTHIRISGLADRVKLASQATLRTDFPQFRAGDTLKVHVRIKEGEKERVQIYEGLVIARSNTGASKSFTVRKISHGVGVERIFLETSPKIAKLEIAQQGKVRRAKLYYIRGLEGKAARIERDIETQASAAASSAAREAKEAKSKEAKK